jgi:AraC-like DNA-binding protein
VPSTQYRLRSNDPDEIADYYARTLFPARVRPVGRSSVIDVSDRHHEAGPVSLWAGACPSGMEVFPSGGSDNLILYLPITGDFEVEAGSKVLRSAPDKILIADASTYRRVKLGEARAHLGIGIAKSEIVSQLAARLDGPVTGPLEFASDCSIVEGPGALLASIAGTLWQGLQDEALAQQAPLALSLLSQSLIALVVDALPHSFSQALRSRKVASATPGHVRRAIEFMQANASLPLTIQDIAEASQVSVRTLQHSFQRFKETSPVEYLRRIRLEAAHRDLIDAGRSQGVAEIARKWGFLHLGRFAAQYRQQYGRSPSKVRGS